MSNSIGSIGDHPLDDLAAYALDALDDAERQAVDDHLSRCYACRAELAGHHETLSVLAGDEAPPAAVWQRIAVDIGASHLPDPHGAGHSTGPASGSGPDPGSASAPVGAVELETERETKPEPGADDGRNEAAPVTPVGPAAPVTSLADARSRRPSRLRWAAAAATLSAAAAAGAVFGFALGDSGDGTDIDTLAEQASQQPNGLLATLQGTSGQPVAQVVADDHGAYIVLDGLQRLPEGQAYQLWSLTGPEPVSLGMLGRDGTNTVAFRLPPTITNLAISVAPTSGDTTPQGPFEASGPVRQS